MRLHVGLDAGGGGLDVEGMSVKSVVQVCVYTNSMGAATTLTFVTKAALKYGNYRWRTLQLSSFRYSEDGLPGHEHCNDALLHVGLSHMLE